MAKQEYKREEIENYVKEITKALDEKKAQDIKILNVTEKTDITDYIIICNGESTTQIRAIGHNVEKKLKNLGIKKLNINSDYEDNTWLLLDFIFAVVHIFNQQTREFYNLEKLWSEAKDITNDFLEAKTFSNIN